ncbi:hypothetical protein QBC39DRAFT_116426 [Podospora conica]|nr:hypothetical protein QBC39DRAFT_116426 [Schizothecium conicum]
MTKKAALAYCCFGLRDGSAVRQPPRAARNRYPKTGPRRRASSVTQSFDVCLRTPQGNVMGWRGGSVADNWARLPSHCQEPQLKHHAYLGACASFFRSVSPGYRGSPSYCGSVHVLFQQEHGSVRDMQVNASVSRQPLEGERGAERICTPPHPLKSALQSAEPIQPTSEMSVQAQSQGSGPQFHEASRSRFPFPVDENPPYLGRTTHFYNQCHTCFAHTGGTHRTPRPWS